MAWNTPSDKKFNLKIYNKKNKNLKDPITQKIKNILIKCKIKNSLLWLKKIIVKFSNNINLSKYFKNSIIITLSILFLLFLFSGFYNINVSECGVITRFGKFNRVVQSGLHWKPIFIDDIKRININSIQERIISGLMLTLDEKLIYIKTNIQYKIINPKDYLFTVIHPEHHLCDIIENALYNVMSNSSFHQILFNKNIFSKNVKTKILEYIKNYKIGVVILDIKLNKIYLPDVIKNIFKKSILSHQYRKKNIQIVKMYNNEIILQVIKKYYRISL